MSKPLWKSISAPKPMSLRKLLLSICFAGALTACGGGGGNNVADTNAGQQVSLPSVESRTPLAAPVTTTLSPGIYLAAGEIGGRGTLDGTGTDARFNAPYAMALDPQGNILVSDGNALMSNPLRKVTPNGEVTTLKNIWAGPIAADAQGNMFVAANAAIVKYAPDGTASTLAGTQSVYGNADGTGAAARFVGINSMTIDNSGNLYVTDRPSTPCPPCLVPQATIRKITPAGVVTTLAGDPAATGDADGSGSAAHFQGAGAITFDPTRNALLVASAGIRKVTLDGVVTTLALDLSGTADPLHFTVGSMAVDSSGNIVATSGYNTIYRITPDGRVKDLAGLGTADGYGYADGTGNAARFKNPRDVVVDAAGNAYVADSGNQAIRKLTPSGVVTTFAGLPATSPSSFVDGKASDARFNSASDAAMDAAGNLYVADTSNSAIRKIAPNGDVTTLGPSTGTPGFADGPANAAKLAYPSAVAVDAKGAVYVADQLGTMVRKIAPDGSVSSVAGAFGLSGFADGKAGSARFKAIKSMVADIAGNLYVTDNASVRKISADGNVNTIAGAESSGYVDGSPSVARFSGFLLSIVLDAAGNLYVGDFENKAIRKITIDGTVSTVRTGAVERLAIDGNGNFYVATDVIQKIAPNGVATIVAGIAGQSGIRLGNLPGALPGVSSLKWVGANVLVVTTSGAVLKVAVP